MAKAGKKPKHNEREEQLKDVKDFLRLWLSFHKSYKRAYKGEEITAEAEAVFLKMKSELARRHVILMERLDEDYISAETIRPVLFQTVTLRQISSIRQEHFDKMENQWHSTYIHLNESIGHLTYLLEAGGK